MVQAGRVRQRSQQHFRDAVNLFTSGHDWEISGIHYQWKVWCYLDWKQPLAVKPDSAGAEAGVDYKSMAGARTHAAAQCPNRPHLPFCWFWDYAGGLTTGLGCSLCSTMRL